MLLLFEAAIEHAAAAKRGFEPSNATAKEIVDEAASICKPATEYLQAVTDEQFIERFGGKYGSGGPLEYFYELSQIILY